MIKLLTCSRKADSSVWAYFCDTVWLFLHLGQESQIDALIMKMKNKSQHKHIVGVFQLAQEISWIRKLFVQLFSHWSVEKAFQFRKQIHSPEYLLLPFLILLMESVIQWQSVCGPGHRVWWLMVRRLCCRSYKATVLSEVLQPWKCYRQFVLWGLENIFFCCLTKSSIKRLKKLLFCPIVCMSCHTASNVRYVYSWWNF